MSKRYFCVHGHFYQPPREDIITGEIPTEEELSPYHNWNEKIHAECYKPNAELGNFGRISFNIGPTLFQWMEKYDPITYKSIIEQERSNYLKYGVGNAIAQPYNHVIMPLASERDKLTQVKWGIADFTHRFGHYPQGMWLPEAAVDDESLTVLSECGIKFTILAPWQLKKKVIDTSHPYHVNLPNGKSISIFFYQMDISTRISFDPGSTSNADRFMMEYLLPAYTNNKPEELIIAASDGELYGHHQKFRDKFLHRLISETVLDGNVEYTYPGLYLQQHTHQEACKIVKNTSWSCHHGISRWMEECGCTPNAKWKATLRNALNEISHQLDLIFETEMSAYYQDPWEKRDDYIQVMLGKMNLADFANLDSRRRIEKSQRVIVRALMESQVARQKMFTSCGWFFDELGRIEPRNNIGYAAQSVLLIEYVTGKELAEKAAALFEDAYSARYNITGKDVFIENYQKAKMNLPRFIGDRE